MATTITNTMGTTDSIQRDCHQSVNCIDVTELPKQRAYDVTATGIPVHLLWLPYVSIVSILLLLLCLSFYSYHRKHTAKYLRRRNGDSLEADDNGDCVEPPPSPFTTLASTSAEARGAWYHSVVGVPPSSSATEGLLTHAESTTTSLSEYAMPRIADLLTEAFSNSTYTANNNGSMINVCLLDMEGVFTSGFARWDHSSENIDELDSRNGYTSSNTAARGHANHANSNYRTAMTENGPSSQYINKKRGKMPQKTVSDYHRPRTDNCFNQNYNQTRNQSNNHSISFNMSSDDYYEDDFINSPSHATATTRKTIHHQADGYKRHNLSKQPEITTRAATVARNNTPQRSGKRTANSQVAYPMQELDVHMLRARGNSDHDDGSIDASSGRTSRTATYNSLTMPVTNL